jgi:hypothetical protein
MVAMATTLGCIQALNYVSSIAPQQRRSSKSFSCNSSRHYWFNLKSQQQRLELMKLGKLELGKRGMRYESQWQCAISDDGENKETDNSEEETASPCCNQVGVLSSSSSLTPSRNSFSPSYHL